MKNIKSKYDMSTSNHHNEVNKQLTQRPFAVVAAEIMAKFKPPAFPFPELTNYLYGWKKSSNFILSGEHSNAVSDLALAFGEYFATHAGPVIWIGCHSEIITIDGRLQSREARVERKGPATYSLLDDAGKIALTQAAMRIDNLPLYVFDIDQDIDSEFLEELDEEIKTDAPTLIIVEPALFTESNLNPFQVPARRANLFQMIDLLQETNPDNRILWQLPLAKNSNNGESSMPSLDDLNEPRLVENADVVMFVQCPESATETNAELTIVQNKFGSLGTIAMTYDQKFSTWLERTIH